MPKSGTNHRPIRVTLLVLLIFAIAMWNALRLVQSTVFWSILKEYQAETGPLYAAISGGFWLLAGLFIIWDLWWGKAWAWFAALICAVGYVSWYWFDKLVFQKSYTDWLFDLVTSVILLVIILFILFSTRTRKFFSER